MPIPFVLLFALQSPPAPAPATGPAPYWQQRVVYRISARLDESTATLSGDERVLYVNHSPDILRTISFHLYLNAFRPGSRWSDADSAEHRRRFNDLKDPDYGFNHVRNVTIDGTPVAATWPFGRDSTIVRFALPKPLAPGDSMTVAMDWDARPSTVPRRQGRRGRHYDFAQWYPKVVVYDKYGWEEHALYPAGEFYGEFGDFFVDLDVPMDQVVGATGVPVCGDPGWGDANRGTTGAPAFAGVLDGASLAEFYPGTHGKLICLQLEPPPLGPPRKTIYWVARNVHNFAITMAPDYRYEGGEWNGIQVHVLYQPGDEKSWGGGVAVNQTITTLKWLDVIFGKYPWPQMTVVHRIEGGGTEFPMMQMNGGASQGLNLHEGGHSYLMGILANNEWREGWMDEGFTSFQTTWWEELQARNDGAERNLEAGMLLDDLDGRSQPVSTVSDKFRDFDTYNNMIYSRGELFLLELRRMVGDSVMLEILHRYYARWALHHVDEDAFRAVAEEVSHRDLKTFFAQWLHEVDLTDYAIDGAKRTATSSGWETTVEISRRAPGVFPVTVAVYAAGDTAYATADGIADRERVVVTTRTKPRRVAIDPDEVSHDWNLLNNRYAFGALFPRADRPRHTYLDTWFSPHASRDRLMVGVMPTAWYNDVGGVTLGVRTHTNYLGRFEENTTSLFCGLRNFSSRGDDSTCGFSISLGNPVWWRVPNESQQLSAFRYEGRAGAGLRVEHVAAAHRAFGPTVTLGGSLQWVATYDMSYLQPTLWDNGGSAEAAAWWGIAGRHAGWNLGVTAKAAGGVMYSHPAGGFTTTSRYDAEAYARPEVTATATRAVGKLAAFKARGYVAGVFSADPVISQRRIFVAEADPYATLSNAFVRSVGAPLLPDNCSCRWHTPGDGDLRGYDPALSSNRLAAINLEVSGNVFRWRQWVSRAAVALFLDAAHTGSERGIGGIGSDATVAPRKWLADAGFGVRMTHRIGGTTWSSRVDFPVYVSDPLYSFAHRNGSIGFDRVVVSFSPVIR